MTVVIEEMVIQTKIVDNIHEKNFMGQNYDKIMKEILALKMELRKKKLLRDW